MTNVGSTLTSVRGQRLSQLHKLLGSVDVEDVGTEGASQGQILDHLNFFRFSDRKSVV